MRALVPIEIDEILPEAADVRRRLGFPDSAPPSARVADLLQRAIDLLARLAAPAGLALDMTVPDAVEVFRGAGCNAERTPLDLVLQRASRACLFAVTLGPEPNRAIARLFAANDFALGAILDAAASEAAERAADRVEERFVARIEDGLECLRYSPGYCGWHLSGQRALFDRMGPEEIGITLSESFLMDPLKSISGMVVAGRPGTHDHDDAYPFCSECASRRCLDRAPLRRSGGSGGATARG